MPAVANLRDGKRVETDPTAWPHYDALVCATLHAAAACRVVLLGPRTPAELRGRIAVDRAFVTTIDLTFLQKK